MQVIICGFLSQPLWLKTKSAAINLEFILHISL